MKSRKDCRLTAAAIIASLLALAACSSPEPPTAAMRSAGDAIARAQENGAQNLAPQPLQSAQDKLNRAHSAAKAEEMTTAEYLAEESEADANYASASSNAQRIGAHASELETLQQRKR